MKPFHIILILGLALFLGAPAQGEVFIETVTIGKPGNAGELSGEGAGGTGPDRICGGVDYAYSIGKFEVTAGQYTAFLSAVARDDTYWLYRLDMWRHDYGCKIERAGSPGTYSYSVAPDWADRPVNFVNWGDAARFANWLHNGQPTGAQGLGTTEDGSYFLNGATSLTALMAVTREPGATWVIPTEDEWYKTAYHKNDGVTANYWYYPTSGDTIPNYVDEDGKLSSTGTPFTEGGIDPGNYVTCNGHWDLEGIGSPYYRTEVGEWENSASPYGTFDQGGNVWEWNEAVFSTWGRGLRGGSFYKHEWLTNATISLHEQPTDHHESVGFRVAFVPEPATLTLLGVGGLLLAIRRRGAALK